MRDYLDKTKLSAFQYCQYFDSFIGTEKTFMNRQQL